MSVLKPNETVTLYCQRCGGAVVFDREEVPRTGVVLGCFRCTEFKSPDVASTTYRIRLEITRQRPGESYATVLASVPAHVVDIDTLTEALPLLQERLAEAWGRFEPMAAVADQD